jgi:AbrB family looped-hinge helix DNA binding protein
MESLLRMNEFSIYYRKLYLICMKNWLLQIDRAGRIVLPQPLRERFNLVPGSKVRLYVEGNCFRFEPIESGGQLIKKGSVLVFSGGFAKAVTTAWVNKMIQDDRAQNRGRKIR